MSVINIDKVDGIAIAPDKKGIKLLISDHLDWDEEYQHLIILQEKINAYIQFCENEQYREVYKDIDFQYGIFEIHFLHEPTGKAMQFLQTVQKQVRELGITIECCLSRGEMNEE